MTTIQKLPHWDMSIIYPSLESPEFNQAFAQAIEDLNNLAQFFTNNHIQEQPAPDTDESLTAIAEAVIERLNTVIEQHTSIMTYISCFVETDSQNTLAQAKLSEFQNSLTLLLQLMTRFTAWTGTLDIESLIERSELVRAHAYTLHQSYQQARHLMPTAEEELATELNVSSGTAWSRLHSNVTSQIAVPLEIDGQVHNYPMTDIRNMADSPDRDLRRRAYEAELAAWQQVSVPLAAALNSIKNEVNILSQHRHWSSALDVSLFQSSIDRETLNAMLSAAHASFPDFRRYLRAKARMLGLGRLTWYDITAPVIETKQIWEYEDSANFIIEQFGSYSTRLSDFAAQAFREQWIDAEPRPGKSGGAFCTDLMGNQSRVLANFSPSYTGMSTLAHELGHAYHNLNLVQRTPLQRNTPMTLAETASIFCETLIRHAAMRNADKQEQIAILEASLQNSCQIVVDITSRFIFEQNVFEKRKQRELSVEELNNLMLDAQRQTYGDGLDETTLHPYMWAVKGHYYSTVLSYYNYPYMFGLLFGLGLYSRYQQDPESFKRGYDDLLSSTGMAEAATLAARFGIDLHTEEFWRASLDIVRQDIDQFESLAG